MSLFSNLKSDDLEQTEDRLGGGFQAVDTDIYTVKIKAAYAGKSKGGAHSITVIALMDGGREYRETVYITNKAGENFFLNKDDKTKKVPLPGFTTIDDLCLAITGESLADQEFEEKVLNIYDFTERKEVATSVQVATALIGQEVSLGIVKELHNKTKDVNGEYVATEEVVERNAIGKVFHTETKMTIPELRASKEKPEFWDKWLEKNKGQVQDKRELKDGQTSKAGAKGAPKAGGQEAAPAKKSLFGNKK